MKKKAMELGGQGLSGNGAMTQGRTTISRGRGSLREPVWSEAEVNMAFHYTKSALSVIEHTTGQLTNMLKWGDAKGGFMGANEARSPGGVSGKGDERGVSGVSEGSWTAGERCETGVSGLPGIYKSGYAVTNHDQQAERLHAGLKRIHLASSRLRHVFQSLLLECGHPRTWYSTFDPVADLAQKVSYYRGVRQAEIRIEKQVKMAPDDGHRNVSLPISPLHWEFLTDTLFGNAISYSGEHPPDITVGWKKTKKMFHFTMYDRGTGIHEEDLPRITEPFYRGRNAGHMPGSGSGLYLISKMMRNCGGNMVITSKIGRFTKVKISIPLR